VAIGGALIGGAATVSALACLVGGMAVSTGFNVADFLRAGGFSGSPSQVRNNVITGLLNGPESASSSAVTDRGGGAPLAVSRRSPSAQCRRPAVTYRGFA